MKKISIIIPFYDEEKNILRLTRDLIKVITEIKNYKFDIFLIDDCSIDQGKNLLKTFLLEQNLIDVNLIENDKNIGKSYSLKKVAKIVQSDYSILMDGDYQDDPKDIIKFLNKIEEGYDLVIGNQNKNISKFKSFCIFLYSQIISLFLNIKDIKTLSPQFLLIKNNYFKDINFKKNDHRYIAIGAIVKGVKYSEISVNYFKRKYGVSKFSKFKMFYAFFEIFDLIYRIKKDKFYF